MGNRPQMVEYLHIADGRSKRAAGRSRALSPSVSLGGNKVTICRTFVKTSIWLLSQYLTFGAGDVLAVLKLDLSSGLCEIAKTSSGRPPEHVVGDRPLRRLGEEDRQVAQVAGLVQDHPFSVLHLRGVQFDIQGGDIWFFT